MSWNHRLVRVQDAIGLFEVYYDDCNVPYLRSHTPAQIWCGTGDNGELDFHDELARIKSSFLKPVLDDSIFNNDEE